MTAHKLTVSADGAGIFVPCSRNDLHVDLGTETTPDAIAKVANEHWGHPVGWLS